MTTPAPFSQQAQASQTFGFAPQMRETDREQFPTSYRARCLLSPVPRFVTPAEAAALRAAA